MMMVVCYDDDVDGVMVMVGVVVAGCGGDVGVAEVARGASVIVDRVDPEVGSVFGVGRKNPAGKQEAYRFARVKNETLHASTGWYPGNVALGLE
ncbi:hypothetical protein Tco_1483906, partial [Tanacetum coccineum]